MEPQSAFDIDGVILDADEIMVDHFNCQGYEVRLNNEYNYTLDPEPEQWVIQEMIDDCIERRSIDMDPFEGVQELFNRFWDRTRRPVSIVTNRPMSSASATTLALSRALGSVPFTLSHTNGLSKTVFLKDCPVFVEDQLQTAVDLAMVGKVVIVPKRRYNWPIDCPSFNPRRSWTWMEEDDIQHYSTNRNGGAPSLWWHGRVIFIESMESFLKNDKLFDLLFQAG